MRYPKWFATWRYAYWCVRVKWEREVLQKAIAQGNTEADIAASQQITRSLAKANTWRKRCA